jgi:AcrR family transcriptional regulator
MSRQPSKDASNIARRRAAARDDMRTSYVARHREIVRVAAQVFKERGFLGTTLSHVADALGTDRASLYYYVSSKEALFQEIVADAVRLNLGTSVAGWDDHAPAPEKLRRLIEGLMMAYVEHHPVLFILLQENVDHLAPEHGEWAEEIKRFNEDYERMIVDIIQAGQDDGTLRATAPAWLLAHGIIGMVGWSYRWFDPEDSSLTAQEIGAAFADTVLLGLTLERPKRRARSAVNGDVTAAAPRPRRTRRAAST